MRVLADGRVRRTAAEWRGVMDRFEESGLSVSRFCRSSKLSRSSFLTWRQRLATSASSAPTFVEWVAPASARAAPGERATPGSGEFELSLPGGVVLRWRA